MKKLIVMVAAIFFTASISAFGTDSNSTSAPSRRINYQLNFTKIELSDDIDLVLQESTKKFINVTGKEAYIDQVDWKIKDGVLYIRSKKGSLKDKVKVTVSVNHLKRLNIYGESVVNSIGELNSTTLRVTIDGDSYVALKNSGAIYIMNSPDTKLDVHRLVGKVEVGG
ncbi:MAG: DUF2807 domain-containing protein [Bacteroidota bacterium]